MREKVLEGLVKVVHVSSKLQLADVFTKALPSDQMHFLLSKMCIRDLYAPLEGECWKKKNKVGMLQRRQVEEVQAEEKSCQAEEKTCQAEEKTCQAEQETLQAEEESKTSVCYLENVIQEYYVFGL